MIYGMDHDKSGEMSLDEFINGMGVSWKAQEGTKPMP